MKNKKINYIRILLKLYYNYNNYKNSKITQIEKG